MSPWASADFFPGEGKKFQGGGGAKTYYLAKKHLKRYYFSQKSKKTYKFGRPGGARGARAPSCPPLRTPMNVTTSKYNPVNYCLNTAVVTRAIHIMEQHEK